MKKATALLMIFILAVLGLQGCSSKKGKNDNIQKSDNQQSEQENYGNQSDNLSKGSKMGRYIEKNISLPELSSGEKVIEVLQNTDQQIELYTFHSKGASKFQCYRWKEDETWEISTPGWLNSISSLSNNILITDMCYSQNGNCYIVYIDYGNAARSHIFMTDDGGQTQKEITIPYLTEKVEDTKGEYYPNIMKIGVLENGNLVLYDQWNETSLLIFSPEGEMIDKVKINGDQSFTTTGNLLITASEDLKGIMYYNTQSNQSENIVDYDIANSKMAYTAKADGTLLIGDSRGIHRLAKEGTLWETTVDGALNSMSMPSLLFASLFTLEGDQEEYYSVYKDRDNGIQIKHYIFDKNVASVPENEITVYSLIENNTIRQAISLYQAEHDDTKINYIVAMGDDQSNTSDYIRALSTELLSGNGADILVLDGLPVEAYIEKGVLVDISDTILPLIENDELLSNIIGSYQEEGIIYRLPTRFSIPLIMGKEDAINAVSDIENITKFIMQDSEPFMSSTTYQKLLADYLAIYSNDIINNGELNAEGLEKFLENLKIIADNIQATEYEQTGEAGDFRVNPYLYYEDLFQGNILSLLDSKSSAMVQINNLIDTVLLISINKNYSYPYSSINQSFIPNGVIGLNSASKEKDFAKNFIQFLFSTKVQNYNLYDGFPVNQNSINKWMEKEDDGFGLTISDKDGTMINANWPSKEEKNDILKVIQDVRVPIEVSQDLTNMIMEESIPYLSGEVDIDQVINTLKSKIDIYLSE